ncbi:MAG: hypothetical protein KGZ25_03940 [Planctomycetes bacterium]|nr:hypothetical protein [Planctomycetota bacterium]
MGKPAFVDTLSQRKGRLKSVLMNQSVIAGIGNVYADEILFQAGWHPELKADKLNDQQLRQLHSHRTARGDRHPRNPRRHAHAGPGTSTLDRQTRRLSAQPETMGDRIADVWPGSWRTSPARH